VTRTTPPANRVIVVDDGSGPDCKSELERFVASRGGSTLIRNDEARGYTKAANQGLRASSAELVVLLNSDTIVTDRWLDRLRECAASDDRIGIVGPLSNAGAFQSVPDVFDEHGDWTLNPLPAGWDPETMAQLVAAIAPCAFPRVAFINGFCFAITRDVIETIGYFDEDNFPEAFGEEDDYCLRAAAAGFSLAIADHAYVYHAKAQSYADARRRAALKHTGSTALRRKHGRRRIAAGFGQLYAHPTLEMLRDDLRAHLLGTSPPAR
jgi:GT2 family glycosyltransferase